jgi:hypothetical protein
VDDARELREGRRVDPDEPAGEVEWLPFAGRDPGRDLVDDLLVVVHGVARARTVELRRVIDERIAARKRRRS